MRKTLYTSLLFFVSFTLSAQTHTLNFVVNDTSTRQIKVATPVNGSYFQAFNTLSMCVIVCVAIMLILIRASLRATAG